MQNKRERCPYFQKIHIKKTIVLKIYYDKNYVVMLPAVYLLQNNYIV